MWNGCKLYQRTLELAGEHYNHCVSMPVHPLAVAQYVWDNPVLLHGCKTRFILQYEYRTVWVKSNDMHSRMVNASDIATRLN